ncbi:putative aminotriazole resistance protein [Lophium mytilinum]|uniref:Putative aminotriazole resistance protein n=1 Tax=Lophium mytilinum TaxID=390894 RepID=A0A6A6QIB8_9PEZI|nr:putative aminotriazole resistance protein [Lophium mytilinum]
MDTNRDLNEIELENPAQPTFEAADHHIDHPFLISPIAPSREALLLITVCSAQALVQACLAQAILPDSIIARSFSVSDTDGTWGPAAYGLTSGTFMLPAGRVGDMFGHRRCFIVAWVWLAVSSLVTGLSVYSRSFVFYSVCRGLQGIAAALLVPNALAILGTVYKEGPRKNLVFSLYAAGAPIGFTIGAVFSGLIAQLSWWPWMFYCTAIASLLFALVSAIAIPKLPGEFYQAQQQDPSAGKHWRKDFDWLGCFTGVSGLVLFNVAWNRAPAVGWQAAEVIALLVVGLALFVAYLFVEGRVKQPLVPIHRISKDASFVLVIMALGWSSFGVLIYYALNFITRLREQSILSAAAQCLPVPFAGAAASYLTSLLLSRGVPASDVLAFSLVWFLVGNIIFATMPVHQLYWKQAFWMFAVAPFGMDMSFPSATLIMSKLVPPDQQGIAASLIATVVYYSQSIGLGIAGTVETSVAGTSPLRGYRGAFYTGIGLSGIGLLVALWPVFDLRHKRRSSL